MGFLLGLIIGCGLGALGYYYKERHTHYFSSSNRVKNNKEMASLFKEFPYLMNLIKSNINDPEYKNIHEFFVVDKLAIMNSSIPRLRYDLSEEMLSLLKQLEELRYIEQLEHDSLLYHMEEEFIHDLRSFDPSILDNPESSSFSE